ncbi:Tricalbin [Penicillium expansum]|uniref:Tricalbin n=1 Tax=Penicillium expansum TaxID=27334 RepID=A0A0A2JGL4_PENEN|nr:Tricalbin [Penicillium expansum]KGO43139.1 Tricalbin [Penicillium expansum]KGO53818.1 Tricalbin [Penicillium expansum]KGO72816.1 Tricalbin [Penicillium expansum]
MASADAEKTEMKMEGTIEAAQELHKDPQSHVNPDLIEEKVVKEAQQAGAAAYQFDPNASPEEKANAAKGRLPPDFHHPHKPTGVAVITDKTDGKADYDLPPPESANAILAEEATRESAGKPLDEDLRWARDRTGWAPKFVDEKLAATLANEGTLLDHETFLEGRIPDKFFGDWYHNSGIIIFACLASWMVAVLGGGVGWVLMVMAACSTYYRTSIRRVRRNFRDDISREMSKQRLETDTESLEWINSFLVKFWPIYAPVLCDTIINTVDQVLSTSTPAFLDSLRLKTFVLGTKPPRLEHVKTYPKTDPDTVIMDWKFSFTPNDITDLTARQTKDKINPKVVLEVRVGKGVLSKGLDVIVEDMACSGLMRVKVKLQIPFPHIERVDVCFLDKPELDYVCKPLGGDHLGFDINFIPGLESFIKDQIHANLQPMMYDPNVFPIEIAKMLAGNPVDQAIGVVAITLHGAQQLKNPDKFSGTPDPYAVVSLNNRNELGRTKTIHDTDSPRWNETIYVIITSFSDALSIAAYDWNEYRKDKEMGVASFALDKLEQEPTHEGIYLEVQASGRHRGAIHADIRFFPVLEGRKNEAGEAEPAPEVNTGIAQFTVEQAKDLDGSKSLVGKLNPYGVLLLNGKEIHITKKLKRTNNPIFQNASKEFLVTDRKNARLGLILKDDRDIMQDPIIGRYQIKMNDMLKMMERGQQWFHLHGAKDGRVKLTLQWKPVALGGIGSAGYIDPIGVMRFHFKRASNLRNLEAMGKSDPYARVLLSGVTRGRTVTFRNNLNPEWDEVVYVPIRSAREKLTVEVMDEETINKDRTLGWCDLNASDFVRETESGEYEIDDEKQDITSSLKISGGAAKGELHYNVSFFPSVPVVNPEDEVEEEDESSELPATPGPDATEFPKKALHAKSASVDSKASKALSNGAAPITNGATNGEPATNGRTSLETTTSRPITGTPSETASVRSVKSIPRTFVSADDLPKYESGFIVFKFHEGQLAVPNVQLEVLMDDYMFPAYVSSKIHTTTAKFSDVGEAFVRELEFSKITLRLVNKDDPKDSSEEHTVAKLTGDTLPTLMRMLYTPTELVLRSPSGEVSKVTVSARYIPTEMKLDPKESINNMGTLRVDVHDAAELPAADRNGFSDPFCKFRLDEETVFKTKVQKKTLHPAWNEYFETPIKSRIGAKFHVDVYDWDFGDKADFLGATPIDLETLEPFQAKEVTLPLDGKSGAIRLSLLFKPTYVIRARQGSSTFSGTFAVPGKIVGAPVKGVGFVGGNVVRGASFLKHGLMSRIHKDKNDDNASILNSIEEPDSVKGDRLTPAATLVDTTPSPITPQKEHSRNRSTASQFGDRLSVFGGGGSGEKGSANITVVSAANFPTDANLRVIVRVQGSKGAKDVHKTKAHKNSSGTVNFDDSFRVSNTTADAQYQVRVVDHATFGSDATLGEAPFFVDDQGSVAGQDKAITVGEGVVTIRSSFVLSDGGLRPTTSHSTAGTPEPNEGAGSPDSRKMPRRSFLSKRSVSGV